MCLGIPMQVQHARPGRAWVAGRGQQLQVDTALVGDCAPGDWLLVFLGAAREALSPARAAEVNAALDLVEGALQGQAPGPAQGPLPEPGFALPSAMSAEDLAALTGQR